MSDTTGPNTVACENAEAEVIAANHAVSAAFAALGAATRPAERVAAKTAYVAAVNNLTLKLQEEQTACTA